MTSRALLVTLLALDGFGVDRRDVMYNDFVILGPASDPARIRGERRAVDVLRKIEAAGAGFLTRGDNSGTHVKEVELWQAAGIAPGGAWYVKAERGAARDPALLNCIAVIRVYPARLPRVNAEGARAFQDWLVSDEAQQIIKAFEVDGYGGPFFFPNSDDWRKRHGGAS